MNAQSNVVPLPAPDPANIAGVEPAARIGLVHDWLTTYTGAERVLGQMIDLFPQAGLFTSIDTMAPEDRFVQHWPFARRRHRALLPLMMLAIEQLDVSECELVLSSSAAIGKGVLTGPGQLHISYVHSPMRYAWDLQHQYLRDAKVERGLKGFLARLLLHQARLWDLRTANGVDHFIANSHFIARRIWKVYRRPSVVIHPPVDIESFRLHERKEDFYLTVSRMVPYKKIPAIVSAFKSLPDRRLVVIGDGPELARVKAAAGPNVEILGYQSSSVVRDYMQRARAFVFSAAQACGTPVIAFGRGGALETVRGLDQANPTGSFFSSQSPAGIVQAIHDFERKGGDISPLDCRANAQQFSTQVFREKYGRFVQHCWTAFKSDAGRERTSDVDTWALTGAR
jgi:glycosyltransferase involved in cell wall biosynthesis